MEDREQHQRHVKDLAGLFRVGQVAGLCAWDQSVGVGVQVGTCAAADELGQVPERDVQPVAQFLLVQEMSKPIRL